MSRPLGSSTRANAWPSGGRRQRLSCPLPLRLRQQKTPSFTDALPAGRGSYERLLSILKRLPDCVLMLAQKLQNETVPDLRLLPEGRVSGLKHRHKLAIGDMCR